MFQFLFLDFNTVFIALLLATLALERWDINPAK